MKILILGDIHGRTCWKDIICQENPDKVIFLGDYVTTHENISNKQQVENFQEIVDYKLKNWDNTIMLMGNHDGQMMGYQWAQMSGWSDELYSLLKEINFKDILLEFTQLAYIDKDIIYSHSGVSDYWFKNISKLEKIKDLEILKPDERLEYNFDTGYGGGYGNSISQSPIWIRPEALLSSPLKGYIQVVGHTPVEKITNTGNVYFCDCLPKQYLVKEDDTFIIKDFKLEDS